jgi:hypothetical protein
MSGYQQKAASLLEQTSAQNPERSIQKAQVFAYMARTEAMTPAKASLPEELYLVSVINEKGQTISVELHMNQFSANMKLRKYEGTTLPEGYEVSAQPIKFAR